MAAKSHRSQQRVRTEIWQVSLGGQAYPVRVSFKTMKTVRLRVVAGGQLRLSAPHGISREWLEQFLRDREVWILQQIEKMSCVKQGCEQQPLTQTERRQALAYLMPMVEKWYPVVQTYGIPMPHVTVRRMRSRYGSCSVGRGRITLAAMLTDVPTECAEYVVLHELTHFLYPNHGSEFYQFIERHMPDHRQREKQLKQASKTMT